MNYVVIKSKGVENQRTCSINDDIITEYHDLSTLLNARLSVFVNEILYALDKTICDDYVLTYVGPELIYKFLLEVKKTSKYCVKLELNKNEIKINGKIENLQVLMEKYKIIDPIQHDIYNTYDSDLELSEYVNPKYKRNINSKIFISRKSNINHQINLIIDEKLYVEEKDNLTIHLHFSDINSCLEILYSEEGRKYINIMIGRLSKLNLTKKDDLTLQYISDEKPIYYVSDLPDTIDKGERSYIEFISIPENYYRIEFIGDVVYDNGFLIGNNKGKILVKILDENSDEIMNSEIECIEHKYVEEIRLLHDIDFLVVNRKQKLDLLLIPEDAEDINSIIYISSDKRKAVFNNYKEIIPLESGEVDIYIKAKKVELVIHLLIKNQLKEFGFEQNCYTLNNGDTIIVPLKLLSDKDDCSNLQWSFDNGNIAYISPSIEHDCCKVTASANMTGNGNLKCYDPISKRAKYCKIVVSSKPKSPIFSIIILCVIVLLLLICCNI